MHWFLIFILGMKLYIVYVFWVFTRCQYVICRRFGTMYQFHLQRLEVVTDYFQPLKMELIHGSETSANHILTPGKYPKEHIQYSNHGESLKSTKLYMFRTVLLSIIRSFSLYTQQCYMSYGVCWQLASRIRMERSDPARKLSTNLYNIHHCCVYSEKLLMMDRRTVRNM